MNETIKFILQYIVAPLITGIVAFLAGKSIQKKKNRPKVTTHTCRISGEQVYTYFDSDNKPSNPACQYLAKNGGKKCFYYEENPAVNERGDVLESGECYIALWGSGSNKK